MPDKVTNRMDVQRLMIYSISVTASRVIEQSIDIQARDNMYDT